MNLRREKDIEQLRRIALMQQVQIEHLLKVLASQSARLDAVTGGTGELQQALTTLDALGKRQSVSEEDVAPYKKPKRKPKERIKFGPTEQRELSRHEQVLTLDEADRTCPSCGGRLEPWKGQFETSEMIDVIEVSYRVVSVRQQKYICKCGGCIETAPGPERATPGGRYSLRFAVKVAEDKYLDHQPLARQSRIVKRHGLEAKPQTLWDQLYFLGGRVKPVYEGLFQYVKRQPVIGLDQTSWKRLDGSKSTPFQMWCLTSPGVVYHQICDDKSEETFKQLLGDYSGTVVCDALSTHAAGARGSPGIVLAGCWAHVFRRFREAEPDHPEAMMALNWIGQLYEIDERAGDDLDLRGQLRRTESTAVLAELKSWLWNQAVLKSLSIGKAAGYTIGQWERLTRFLDDPRIPLDNNQTERGIRGPVVGRKNHYGSKSKRGTEVAAIFYTLFETAKLGELDPAAYLLEAARAASFGEVLLPQHLCR